MLPKNEKRTIDKSSKIKLWVYGVPYSGKTTLADQFPDVLFLNTDGNINSFTSPVVEIKEQLVGRESVKAWEVFKNTIDELQQGSEFKTIVVDLLEDTYEACRLYCYDKLCIEHESDNSFKAWDFVRNEFLNTMKKLTTLKYHIVLISHEDTSKDVTKKNGDAVTAIKPNIQEKIANKVSGMVDATVRLLANGNDRKLDFKTDDVVFGGGRLKLKETEIPVTFEALLEVYNYQDNLTTEDNVYSPTASATKHRIRDNRRGQQTTETSEQTQTEQSPRPRRERTARVRDNRAESEAVTENDNVPF